jgi:hypothetical protein
VQVAKPDDRIVVPGKSWAERKQKRDQQQQTNPFHYRGTPHPKAICGLINVFNFNS